MAVKQVILIPIFWGEWWTPSLGNAYNWADLTAPMARVVTGRYMDGLNQYGFGRGTVSKTYLHQVDPAPGGFGEVNLQWVVRSAVDAGHVARPEEFDLATQQPCYCVIVAPDPNHDIEESAHFDVSHDVGDGRSPWVGAACWVRADETAAGTVRRWVREITRVCTVDHDFVADRCEAESPVFVDRVSVPQYWSAQDHACWPAADIAPVERRSQHALDQETQRLLDAQFEGQLQGAGPAEGRVGLHRREDDPT